MPAIDAAAADAAIRDALAPFERAAGEGAYQVQHELQEMMQDLVGIVRREDEMERALDGIAGFRERAAHVSVAGHREYNPGWHTALDLGNLLVVSEAIARSANARRESRGGHFREDFPEKSADGATFNHVIRKRDDGGMALERVPIPPMRDDLRQIIDEMK
jgi:succinate dehydrogenase / fumarate reductase flavoprotein subunit